MEHPLPTLQGGWRAIKKLGSGGQGTTYLVTHEDEHRYGGGKFVAKLLTSTKRKSDLERFAREYNFLTRISHPLHSPVHLSHINAF